MMVRPVRSPLHVIGKTARTCGSCTACCVHIPTTEAGIAHDAHVACAKLGDRCTIYGERPQSCRDFSCAWLEGMGNDAARPDRSGALIFMANVQGQPAVSAWATKPGGLDEGTEARTALVEVGFTLPVALHHFDGRTQLIMPTAVARA